MSLSDIIQNADVKASIVDDCNHLIDEKVSHKGGVSGMALKTAYRVVKGIGPTYVRGAIGRVLPDALTALDPMWQEGLQTGDPVQYICQNPDRAADVLLSVTDTRIQYSSGAIVTVYNKLRKSVKGDIEEAVPQLASILSKHTHTPQRV